MAPQTRERNLKAVAKPRKDNKMYLGLDLGTSAVKLCVIDATGQLVAQAAVDLEISYPFEGAS